MPRLSTAPAYRLPISFAFKEKPMVCLIRGVASSQKRRRIGGTMPELTMTIAFLLLSERGVGQPLMGHLPGLEKTQQIRSKNVF